MSKLTNQPFDYSFLSGDDKGKLIYFEGEIVKAKKKVAEEIISIGEVFKSAQTLLANYSGGSFVSWLDANGVSTRSAYNAIDAWTHFRSFANLQNIEVSAMYALAKHPKAKKKAAKLIDRGVRVTHSMAKKLIEASSDNGKPGGLSSVPRSTREPEAPVSSGSAALETDSPPFPIETSDEWEDVEDDPPWIGEDGPKDRDGMDAQETAPKAPRSGTESEGDLSKELALLRSKAVKTVEALMRCLDDLQASVSRADVHEADIDICKRIIQDVREWK